MRAVALIAVLALALVSPAFAQTVADVVPEAVASPEAAIAAGQDTSATIYIGNIVAYIVGNLKEVLLTLILGAVALASASLPGFAGYAIRFFMANIGEKFISNLLDYALNAVKGATKDKELSIPVGSAVVAAAIERMMALENLDPWIKSLIKFLGGKTGVAEKMFRRMELGEGATAENVLGAGIKKAGLPYPVPHVLSK